MPSLLRSKRNVGHGNGERNRNAARRRWFFGNLEACEDRTLMATAFGVTAGASLVRFDTATPGTIISSTPITNVGPGEIIEGIDFRPATGQLYSLTRDATNVGHLYTINTATATATLAATLAPDPADLTSPYASLNGTSFGVDFNPVPDRLRVVSNTGQNLRINVSTGLVTTDSDLNPGTPNVAGAAYSNNFAGATTTTLYGIDFTQDILLIQNPPNEGTLTTVGALGVDVDAILGFDIVTTNGNNTGLATLIVGGIPGLYQIDLTTGAASAIGSIGGGATLRGLAIAPQGFTASLAGNTATFTGTDADETIIFDQSGGLLRHNRFSAGDSGFNSDFDFDSTTPGDQTLSVAAPAASVIVNAGGGNDTTIIDFAGGNPIPVNGIQFDGGLGSDRLVLRRSSGAFTATNESYTALTTDTGLINIDGSTISFAGLEPIDDTLPAANFTFNAPAGQQSIEVVNGPTVSGFATTQIRSPLLPPAFELINFANKTNAIVNTSLGNDTVVLNNPIAATGLTGLTINTGGGTDQVNLVATPPGVATVVNTGSEDDIVTLSASSIGAGGSTSLDGGAGTDTLRFDAQNQPYTVTPTSLTFNGQVVNFINFEAVQISNAGGTPVTPVLPPLPINAIEGTQIVDVIVARFTDADVGAKAADYVATIAWGDGTTSSGIVTQDASNPSLFYVTGTHLFRDQGNLFVTTTIVDLGTTTTTIVGGVTITTTSSEPPVSTTSPATVADAPITAAGATVSGSAETNLTSLVATFTTTDPDATTGDFLALIAWGDGTAPSVGTISVVGALPNGLTFRVMGTHAYARPGVYAVTTSIVSIGGSTAVANGTAVIAESDRFVPLFGQLQLASDTGISNTDGITNDNTPTFVGTSQPGTVVRIYIGNGVPSTRLYIASAVTDAAGTWEATVLQPLPDGNYSYIAAEGTSRTGMTSGALILNQLVIDTVGPKVTDLIFDRLSGRIGVAFQDDRSGLDQFGLIDGANYRFAGLVLVGARRNTPILITNASTTASNDPTAAQSVTLTLNRGRQIRGGKFTFTILSGGIQDVAGNGLDGDFYGYFPSGNNRPGGDFVARIDSVHRVVSAPIPIQNGSASPLTPPGRRGQGFVLGPGTNRFQPGTAIKKLGQAHPTSPNQALKAASRPTSPLSLRSTGQKFGRR